MAVLSDKTREADELVNVKLSSPVNATLAVAAAKGAIVNDDIQVGLSLPRTTGYRVRASVATLSAASGASVKLYRVTGTGSTRLLSSSLDRYGRISAVLGRSYKAGAKVTVYATVKTVNGLYTSQRASVTVRR